MFLLLDMSLHLFPACCRDSVKQNELRAEVAERRSKSMEHELEIFKVSLHSTRDPLDWMRTRPDLIPVLFYYH